MTSLSKYLNCFHPTNNTPRILIKNTTLDRERISVTSHSIILLPGGQKEIVLSELGYNLLFKCSLLQEMSPTAAFFTV